MATTADAPYKRQANGTFAAGTAPGPGRPSLPDEFKAKGPDALAKLVELMDDENRNIALRAAEIVAERVYGKASQPLEHSGQDLLDIVAERVAQRMNGHSEPAKD